MSHRRMRRRTGALTCAAVLAVGGAACAPEEQGTAERGADATQEQDALQEDDPADQPPENEPTSEPEPEPEPEQPDTELGVGDTFRYNDDVAVTVTGIAELGPVGEFETGPEADEIGFRVTWTITNGSGQPLDLDDLGGSAAGASTGGETDILTVEEGSKEMTGRLADGRTGTYNQEWSVKESDGTDIAFTMSRMDLEDESLLAEDPTWTGTIKRR